MACKMIFLILSYILLHCMCISQVDGANGKLWVVCVAGYDRYRYTYGFEAGVYRACNMFGGVKNDQVIVIAPDSAAYHPKNPFAGKVNHGYSESTNDYPPSPITYKSEDITRKLFYEILKGNKKALQGVGQEKVVQSGPNDTILLLFNNVGDHGFMTLSNKEYLSAEEFIPFIEDLKENRKFDKMFIYVDGESAGSMFDNYLDTDKRILALTNTAVEGELELCHFNEAVSAYTSTCFTYFVLGQLENLMQQDEYTNTTVWNFFQKVRTETAYLSSVPQLYGQLDLALLNLPEFFGPQENLIKGIEAQRKLNQYK